MVGEIRDAESAKIVFEAAVTGHLVLSTLHASFATDVVPRLSELGVPAATMATGLLGVVSQRLLRAVCKKCLTMRPSTEAEQDLFKKSLPGISPPREVPYGRGCLACDGSGYHSRIPVFETWRNGLEMRNALSLGGSPTEILKIAREDGYETLFEFGLKMVLSGFTTVDEVKRVLTSI